MFPKILDWIKKNPIVALIVVVALIWTVNHTWSYRGGCALLPEDNEVERFSSCLQKKQIYLNSCDPEQPGNVADVNIENRFGKMYININAQLPFADGSDFHSHYGAYWAFLIDPVNKVSIPIGTLVRHGDGFFKLANELLGDYTGYTRLDIYRQVLDYKPKRVLTGSITAQNCSSL